MSTPKTSLSIEIRLFVTKLKKLDLGPVAFSLKHQGWTQAQIVTAIGRYLMFLLLIYLYPSLPIVPTKEIDQVWHQHILDTSKYAEDCEMLFGRFVHHFPYFGKRGDDDRQEWLTSFTETQQLFATHFGETIELTSNDTNQRPVQCKLSANQHGNQLQSTVLLSEAIGSEFSLNNSNQAPNGCVLQRQTKPNHAVVVEARPSLPLELESFFQPWAELG